MSRPVFKPAPQMQAGGWMTASKDPIDIRIEQTASQLNPLDAATMNSRKLVRPVSIDGRLDGCLQGFVAARNSFRNQTDAIEPFTVQKRVAYAASIMLYPEGLRKGSTLGVFPSPIPGLQSSSMIESGTAWAKSFSSPILCALQQVFYYSHCFL